MLILRLIYQDGKTDRGRTYILYGPPDQIDRSNAHTSSDANAVYPEEIWHYRYIAELRREATFRFSDACRCGEYNMMLSRSDKDGLLDVPADELKTIKQAQAQAHVEVFVGGVKWPTMKLKDLEDFATHHVSVAMLPFGVETDSFKISDATDMGGVSVTIRNQDLAWEKRDGSRLIQLEVFGRLITLTGRIAYRFEDTISRAVPETEWLKMQNGSQIYCAAVPLMSRRYRLELVLRDVNADRAGTWYGGMTMRDYSEDTLGASSLILGDGFEHFPGNSVLGNPVYADTTVHPRPGWNGRPPVYKWSGNVALFAQIYNLAVDLHTNRPDAVVEYKLVNSATHKSSSIGTETAEHLNVHGQQMTVSRLVPIADLQPGRYEVEIQISDR